MNFGSGGKATEMKFCCWKSADILSFDNRQINIVKSYRTLFHKRTKVLVISVTCLCEIAVLSGVGMVGRSWIILECNDQECINKVPWFRGRKPKEIYWLDNPDHLDALGLVFREKEKRADYYICTDDNTWILIERKDGSSRLELAITQIKDTKKKLKDNHRPVNRVVTIADKLGHNDSLAFGHVQNKKHLLYSKSSNKRDGLPVCDIDLEFYTPVDLQRMKRGETLWQ